ncbi:MAG: amino acid ABC transporter permease [Clostridiales bacterium]|nr:amino acid ABC transporter permease [Clostridiales bacterium]
MENNILYNIIAFFTSPEKAQWFVTELYNNFISESRWKWLLNGLVITIRLTVFAFIFGLILGLIIAMIRVSHDSRRETNNLSLKGKIDRFVLSIANFICKIYLNVIQGTPTIVQIMIIYFVILANSTNKIFVATFGFTINSSAYIAEIIRGGLNGVDPGQAEAGRSLGFGYLPTMIYIVIPQALKSTLPALCNELVVLLKETSVASMVALQDLLAAALLIKSRTYSAFFPLIAAALIYLVIVSILRAISFRLERRLNSSDR